MSHRPSTNSSSLKITAAYCPLITETRLSRGGWQREDILGSGGNVRNGWDGHMFVMIVHIHELGRRHDTGIELTERRLVNGRH